LPRKRFDYTGFKFNKLTVLEIDEEKTTRKGAYWKVQCDCGIIYSAYIYEVKNQSIKQCKKCSNKQLSIRYKKFTDEENLISIKLKSFKDSAKKRGYDCLLTKEQVKNLIFQNCYYCNKEPLMFRRKYPNIKYNSIDRVDNDVGYLIENCVPCCRKCNMLKGALTEIMIIRLYEIIQKRKNEISW
jgi:hypothetical protein